MEHEPAATTKRRAIDDVPTPRRVPLCSDWQQQDSRRLACSPTQTLSMVHAVRSNLYRISAPPHSACAPLISFGELQQLGSTS
uniref:Uncharacterized protein n=1 Tax=Ascaris lumbricoides TaxID=6252 RepID=A0A0M3HXZ5_ASCLU